MSVKRSIIAFVISLCLSQLIMICCAESTAYVAQIYSWDNYADIFVSNAVSADDLECRVSNKTADIVECGPLTDKGVTVKTTYLVDVSTSIPQQMRDSVKEYINLCIGSKAEYEAIRLITFGSTTTVLQDFTFDRYDLSVAAEKLKFEDKESKLYEAVYNTIPEMTPIDDKPCFYRTIVITDGAGSKSNLITAEEVYLNLKEASYPVNVVQVSADKGSAKSNDSLSALSRVSGGNLALLSEEQDLSEISEALDIDNYFWIRIKMPEELLDGSTRQFDISDGTSNYKIDHKVEIPIYSENTAESKDLWTLITGDYLFLSLILSAIIVIVIVFVIILIVISKNKKKKREKPQNNIYPLNRSNDKTEVIGSAKTELLNAGSGQRGGAIHILLKNINSGQQWELDLSSKKTLGRQNGDVIINENSVSREQCVFYADNDGNAYVENLSNSNITMLNGEDVTGPTVMIQGDRLSFGRITLIVDLVSRPSGSINSHNNNNSDINMMTEFASV